MKIYSFLLSIKLFAVLFLAANSLSPCWLFAADGAKRSYDVVVFGGTSGGIAAAVQVKRMGHSVVVLEPTSRIGGLTTGGLGATDIGNKTAIGGISREFYQRIHKHYADSANWKWQERKQYQSSGHSRTQKGEDAMWTFEPSVALSVMESFVSEHDIPVVYNARLDRTPLAEGEARVEGISLKDGRIVAITTESGTQYRGRVFIDATYEGDLLAGAGVSYVVGREDNSIYGETLSGVQTRNALHHQFRPRVDPYVTPGDPKSGLLPGIDPNGPGKEGAGDKRVQTYCFRMCLTDHPENRIPFEKPADYEPELYELLFRNFEAGAKVIPWSNTFMPNRKTDVNNNRGFSTDFIGQNYDYPEASYDDREKIVARHLSYQRGLIWTFANHPRVPKHVRDEISRWGTCKDEFERENGWQQQLYIREARRMVGDYVMTQRHCQGQEIAKRPISLAAYTMDSHNVQRYVDADGYVKNEGDVQVGGFSPYPIDYGSIIPKKSECTNLFVPVCLSASHMAFGSIRMEPVFMVLGQSAATAAVLAVESDVAVQDIDFGKLEERLLKDRQVLVWTGPKRTTIVGINPETLKGIVVDDVVIDHEGFDSFSRATAPFIGVGYRHDSNQAKGQQAAIYRVKLLEAGKYEVRLAWSASTNRASNVPVTIRHGGETTTVYVNQRRKPPEGAFGTLGTYAFEAGEAIVTIGNTDTDGYVIADALQFIAVE
ncbi:MAG: FAD-dependent oxidoreductase [Planctomycetes bacterium]|nr:FAD-dependent oxidoreductase [Planctomycetota bacterium]